MTSAAIFMAGFLTGSLFALFVKRQKNARAVEVNVSRDSSSSTAVSGQVPQHLNDGYEKITLNKSDLLQFFKSLKKIHRVVSGILDDTVSEVKESGGRWAAAVAEMVDKANAGLAQLNITLDELASGGEGKGGLVGEAQRASQHLVDTNRISVASFLESSSIFTEIIKELKSEKMKRITEQINGMLRQSNIVALNAEIEAAHLGNAGRGIGVIAGEIRKLNAVVSESVRTITDMFVLMENQLKNFEEELKLSSGQASRLAEEAEVMFARYLENLNAKISNMLVASKKELDNVLSNLSSIIELLQYQDISLQKINNMKLIIEELDLKLDDIAKNVDQDQLKKFDTGFLETMSEKYTTRYERFRHELVTGEDLIEEKPVGIVDEKLGSNVELF